MKPFENLQKFDRLIGNLKYQLKYSKNKKETDKLLIGILEVRNSFNEILNSSFYIDVIETLIFDLLLTKIRLDTKKDQTEIYDLDTYLANIGQIIKEGKDLKGSELISLLKLPYETMTIKDFEENDDLERTAKIFNRIPKNENFIKVLQEFTDILKSDIILKKIK